MENNQVKAATETIARKLPFSVDSLLGNKTKELVYKQKHQQRHNVHHPSTDGTYSLDTEKREKLQEQCSPLSSSSSSSSRNSSKHSVGDNREMRREYTTDEKKQLSSLNIHIPHHPFPETGQLQYSRSPSFYGNASKQYSCHRSFHGYKRDSGSVADTHLHHTDDSGVVSDDDNVKPSTKSPIIAHHHRHQTSPLSLCSPASHTSSDQEEMDEYDDEEDNEEEIDIDDCGSTITTTNTSPGESLITKHGHKEGEETTTSSPGKENSFQTYHLSVAGLLDKNSRYVPDGVRSKEEMFPHGIPPGLGWPSHLPGMPWMGVPGYPKPGW